jgi:hypothetical protein
VRAGRAFFTDEKRIRAGSPVRVSTERSAGFYAIGAPRGRFLVRATLQLCDIELRA